MTVDLVRGRQVYAYESHDAVGGCARWTLRFAFHCFSALRAQFGVRMRDALQGIQRTHARDLVQTD